MNRERLTHKADALLLAPATVAATAGTDAVDLQGFDAVEVVVAHGDVTAAAGANNFVLSLSSAPDGSVITDLGAYSAVAAADVVGSFDTLENGVLAGVQRVGYIGTDRYLRVVITETGTASAEIGIVALLELSDREPANVKTPDVDTPA